MRGIFFLGTVLAVLGTCELRAADPVPAANTPERVALLVKQLGSSRFAEREKAQRALEAIGIPALDILRKAVASPDQETSRRASELVQKIDAAVLTAKLLAPKRVKLDLSNTPVPAAVAELERQSGYVIHIALDVAADNRKVTLATGDVTFWEAFDALCLKAHLVEVNPAAANKQPYPRNAEFFVKDGNPAAMATCYAGAVRIRALPPSAAARLPRAAGEAVLLLEVSPEPRLEHFAIDGSPILRKAWDDQGQTLALVLDAAPANPNALPRNRQALPYGGDDAANRPVTVRFKLGEKQATHLKQLQGALTAKILTPTEPLAVVDNVLKAAGQTVKGKAGGSLQVLAVAKEPNGDIQMRFRMANLGSENPLGNLLLAGQPQIQQVQIRVGGGFGGRRFLTTSGYNSPVPLLVDARGRSFQMVQIPRRNLQINNGEFTEELAMIFRPQQGQGEAARLVVNGQRLATVPVSFSFGDVPLQ